MMSTPEIESIAAPNPVSGPVSRIDPGFELQEPNGSPVGRNNTGTLQAASIENKGHSSGLTAGKVKG
jgi:hypothetical protein